MDKKKLVAHARKLLSLKMDLLKSELSVLSESQHGETKSSAGDKYETSREMIQAEKLKLQDSLRNQESMINTLNLIDTNKKYSQVAHGALVKMDGAYYFISIGLGSIDFQGVKVFLISNLSPLGTALVGKKQGDVFWFSNAKRVVEEVY